MVSVVCKVGGEVFCWVWEEGMGLSASVGRFESSVGRGANSTLPREVGLGGVDVQHALENE